MMEDPCRCVRKRFTERLSSILMFDQNCISCGHGTGSCPRGVCLLWRSLHMQGKELSHAGAVPFQLPARKTSQECLRTLCAPMSSHGPGAVAEVGRTSSHLAVSLLENKLAVWTCSYPNFILKFLGMDRLIF